MTTKSIRRCITKSINLNFFIHTHAVTDIPQLPETIYLASTISIMSNTSLLFSVFVHEVASLLVAL